MCETVHPLTPSVIRAALGGDRLALERLVEEILPVVQSEAAYVLARRARVAGRDPRGELEDMVQDVCELLWSNGGRLLLAWDPERGRGLTSFVRMIARRRIARLLERRTTITEATGDVETAGQLESEDGSEAAIIERAIALDEALSFLEDRLEPAEQCLFELFFVQERPVDEVARALEISAHAVHGRCNRLRQKVERLTRGLRREDRHPPLRLQQGSGRGDVSLDSR